MNEWLNELTQILQRDKCNGKSMSRQKANYYVEANVNKLTSSLSSDLLCMKTMGNI